MTINGLPQNTINTPPKLADLIAAVKKSIALNMNCHAIGTIQSFDAETQTARVTVNYQKTIKIYDAATQKNTQVNVPYPVISQAPVWFPRGGGAGLTLPVTQKDECVIMFNDRDMDNYLAGQVNGGPATSRLHSFADAMIFVGLGNVNNLIQDFDTVRALLYNGTTGVGVGPSLIKIYNSSYTLNQLLQQLITQIKAITVGPGTFANSGGDVAGTSGGPNNASDLANTATQIGELLE